MLVFPVYLYSTCAGSIGNNKEKVYIMNFKKGNRDPEKVTKQGEDIVRVSV